MQLFKTYLRVLSYLKRELTSSILICLSNITLAIIAIAEPILFGKIIYSIAHKQPNTILMRNISFWIGFGIFDIIAYILVARSADKLSHRLRASVLSESFSQILTIPIAWHQSKNIANPLQIIMRGCDTMSSIWLEFMRQHLATIVSLILVIPTVIAINYRLSYVLAVLSIVYILVARLVMKKTQKDQESVSKEYHNVFSQLSDCILNLKIVQSYNLEKKEQQRLDNHLDKLLKAQYPVLNWWALASGLNRMSSTICIVLIIGLGAFLVNKNQLDVGQVVAFVGFGQLVISKLEQISGFFNLAISSRVTLEEFFVISDLAKQIDPEDNKIDLPDIRGDIKFENVCFEHANSDQGIENITFHLKPGQTLALVGTTGAGKTTIVNLLQRIYPIKSGAIYIDDININDISLLSLRSNISVVYQESNLFNRSIEENIAIGDLHAAKEQIIEASKNAKAHDFIMKRPEGYQAIVGQAGCNLSGGEKQRISIARAILKKSSILIMDEATSALDVETENYVKHALEDLYKQRTTIIIAHRLSTVKNADLVIVMDQGKAIEMGSYYELSHKNGGAFRNMLKQSSITIDE